MEYYLSVKYYQAHLLKIKYLTVRFNCKMYGKKKSLLFKKDIRCVFIVLVDLCTIMHEIQDKRYKSPVSIFEKWNSGKFCYNGL